MLASTMANHLRLLRLYNLPEIDRASESLLHCFHVQAETVSAHLDAVFHPRRDITHKRLCVMRRALAQVERRNGTRVGADSQPKPEITHA